MSSHRYALTAFVNQLSRPIKDESSFWQGRVIRILGWIIFGLLICVIPLGLFAVLGMQFIDNYGQEGTYFLLATGAFALSVSLVSLLFFLLGLSWLLRESLKKEQDRRTNELAMQVEPRWGKRSTEAKSDTVDLKGRAKRAGIALVVGAVGILPFIAGVYFGGNVALDLFHGPQVVEGAVCLDVKNEYGKTNGGRRNPFPRQPYVEHIFTLQIPGREDVVLRARVIQDGSDRTIPEKILTSCTLSTPFTLTYYPHSSVLVNAE